MRVKYKDIDIECTVDEYEEMVARGLLGEKPTFDPNDFVKKWNELDKDKPNKERQVDSPFDVVMVYGVHLPNGGFQPKWPNNTYNDLGQVYKTSDSTAGTEIAPTQDNKSTRATVNKELIKVNNLDWNELIKAK